MRHFVMVRGGKHGFKCVGRFAYLQRAYDACERHDEPAWVVPANTAFGAGNTLSTVLDSARYNAQARRERRQRRATL